MGTSTTATSGSRPTSECRRGQLRDGDAAAAAVDEANDGWLSEASASLQIAELTSAAKRRDEFMTVLSHELRSPLSSIQQAIDVLRRPGGAEETVQRGMYELIERQVRQLIQLASGLLDASRISRGILELHCERIDLRAVLTNAIETLDPEFQRRGSDVVITWPESNPWVMADASRLEQVFVNLLANAAKYTDSGGRVAVSTEVNGGFAHVRISDSGIGIAPTVLPHIFKLYMQAASSAARSEAGLGVGLALVRTIVDLHGGQVSASSAGLGRGSEFTVTLQTVA